MRPRGSLPEHRLTSSRARGCTRTLGRRACAHRQRGLIHRVARDEITILSRHRLSVVAPWSLAHSALDVRVEDALQTCVFLLGLRWWLNIDELVAVDGFHLLGVSAGDLRAYATMPDAMKQRARPSERGVLVHMYKNRTPYFYVFEMGELPPLSNTDAQRWVVARFKEWFLRRFMQLAEELCREASSSALHGRVTSRLAETVLGLNVTSAAHRSARHAIVARFEELRAYLPEPDPRQPSDDDERNPAAPRNIWAAPAPPPAVLSPEGARPSPPPPPSSRRRSITTARARAARNATRRHS